MVIDANVLEIDLGIIKKNVEILRSLSNKKFFAVVKANAYGLGAVEISKFIEDNVDMFCVANINEAIELRKSGIKKDILILGYIHPKNYKYLNEYNIIVNIYDFEIAKEMNKLGKTIRGHIKIETGHNRLGFKPTEDNFDIIRQIDSLENINIEGMFSHLSSADEADREYTYLQYDKFQKSVDGLSDINANWIKHISNDAGLLAYDVKYDGFRSGISLYGMYPSQYMKEKYNVGIENSFRLISSISFIKELEKGEGVSYNHTFIAEKKMKIATVSIGYADGYFRIVSNKGFVLINGKKAKILGRVTMDQLMVDISDIEAKLHDEVVLIGKSGEEYISPDLIAKWANTISYEIMTSISNRVYRVYKNKEKN
ncbi:alanine racemase [Helcococcus ovis]|uniref:alanine racemase n=1 Tax=Helcococcus ovis TaxID=72026 RepID=UPI001FD6F3C6|nr:alanine racemase [Helcococcus ovis]